MPAPETTKVLIESIEHTGNGYHKIMDGNTGEEYTLSPPNDKGFPCFLPEDLEKGSVVEARLVRQPNGTTFFNKPGGGRAGQAGGASAPPRSGGGGRAPRPVSDRDKQYIPATIIIQCAQLGGKLIDAGRLDEKNATKWLIASSREAITALSPLCSDKPEPKPEPKPAPKPEPATDQFDEAEEALPF
jgi:hypothetical protein